MPLELRNQFNDTANQFEFNWRHPSMRICTNISKLLSKSHYKKPITNRNRYENGKKKQQTMKGNQLQLKWRQRSMVNWKEEVAILRQRCGDLKIPGRFLFDLIYNWNHRGQPSRNDAIGFRMTRSRDISQSFSLVPTIAILIQCKLDTHPLGIQIANSSSRVVVMATPLYEWIIIILN